MEMFFHHFPELAIKETRTINLMDKENGPDELPPGAYSLVEAYCTDPDCDCRRVILNVIHDQLGLVAVISLAFDADAPYAEPMLDPLNPQSKYAEQILDLACSMTLYDPEYRARLERHYYMVKGKFGMGANSPSPNPQPAEERWWKRRRKKPRR